MIAVDAALVTPWMLAADAAFHPSGGDRDNAHKTRHESPTVSHLHGDAPCSAHEVRKVRVPIVLSILPWAMSLTVWHAG